MTSDRVVKLLLPVGLSLVLLLIQGCVRRTVVLEKSRPSQEKRLKQKGVYHVVQRHQTLYRVCKTYGVDIREVTEVNGIADPTRIQVGQRIFIPGAEKVLKVEILLEDVVEESEEGGGQKASPRRISLDWPVQGKCVDFFEGEENRRHQGIDIACSQGTPIKAAGAGKVIYSGNTIRGYGNLIILRHPEEYVTIYAHNEVNLVKEGMEVERGQTIGRVGRTGNATGPHLHFEVRRKNTAVDPLPFLR
jgi:murein DD-endopeptidase MepM/ murein hydrolase activator NlpD